jgi:hypothetical protein
MGKDRENVFHPAKGKPSGANKQEGTGLRETFPPDQLEQDNRMTERYTVGEDKISPDVHVRHANRNTSKGEDFSETKEKSYKSRNETFNENFTKTIPEELLGILTKDIFNELGNYQSNNCISILMRTHKAGMKVNEQEDMISFKNALQHVEKALHEKKVEEITIKKILKPGYDLLRDDKFWYSLTDGLAVYIADGFFKYLRLNGAVADHVRVNSSFYVSPLVPFMVRKEYFYLLDIAKKFPRFYRVDALGIEHLEIEEMPTDVNDVVHFEEKEAEKLFRTGGKGGTGSANFHGIGGGKPDEKEHIAIYLKEVDNTIWQTHLHDATVPLLLSGQSFLIPLYRSVSKYAHIWPEALTGNHHQQSDKELYDEAMNIMQPYFDEQLNKALADYGNKSATQFTSTSPEHIIPGAHYGRLSHLFVKRGVCIWGTFNEQENKLNIVPEEREGVEDLVDRTIIKTIQTGGEVYILDGGKMPQSADITAIFRY